MAPIAWPSPSRCVSGRSPKQQLRESKDTVCDRAASHHVLRLLAWPWSFDHPFFMPLPVPCCFPSSGCLRLPVFAPLPTLGFALPAAELAAPCCFPPLWFCLSRTIFFLLSSAGALHLLVVVVSRHLDPKSRVTYSTQSLLFCLCSLLSFLFSVFSNHCQQTLLSSTKKTQQGSGSAMTTLACVAKSVKQYQCPCYSSQGVRIRTCAKGTNSQSAKPRRDGGTTRGRCGTMETASCLCLCLAASLPAVVCVCLSLLLCHLWSSRCLLQSWMLWRLPCQPPPSCIFVRLGFRRDELVSELR